MITRLDKHNSHQVRVHLTSPGSKHYAALRCVDCNQHIQWLSKQDSQELQNLGVETKQFKLYTAKELGI